MLFTFLGIVTLLRLIQPINVPVSILSIFSGIIIPFKLEQPANAYSPILLTFSDKITLSKLEQLLNASFPIFLTLFGIAILFNLEHPLNADASMLSTPSNKITLSNSEQLLNALSDSQTNIVQLSSEVSLSRPLAFTEGEKVIDLNGFGLEYTGTESEYSMITVGTDASLTLINGNVSGTTQATAYTALKTNAFNMEGGKLSLSKIDVSGVDTAVYVADMNAEAVGDSVVQINSCNLTGEQAAMILQGNGGATESTTKVMIYDSKLSGKYYIGISGQGNDDRWGTELVIAKSEVSGAYAAIYQPQRKSVTTITESTLSGNTGIAVKGGTVNIYDSKVTGTGAISTLPAAIAKSGFTDTGDGVYVEVAYGWSAVVTLNGKNNEVISDKAYAVEMIAEQGMGPGKVLIYDGTYKGQLGETKWNNIGTFERYDVTTSEAE